MSTSLRLFVFLLGFGLGAIGGTAILIAAYSR
jgi:hypothetical protein